MTVPEFNHCAHTVIYFPSVKKLVFLSENKGNYCHEFISHAIVIKFTVLVCL